MRDFIFTDREFMTRYYREIKMKKGLIFLLCMIILLTGCTDKKGEERKEQTESVQETEKNELQPDGEETEDLEKDSVEENEKETASDIWQGTEIQSSLIQEDDTYLYVCGSHKILKIDKETKESAVLWEGEKRFWKKDSHLFSQANGVLIGDNLYFLEERSDEEEDSPFYESSEIIRSLSVVQTDGSGYRRILDCDKYTYPTLFMLDGVLYFEQEDGTEDLLGYRLDDKGVILDEEEQVRVKKETTNYGYLMRHHNGSRIWTELECKRLLGYVIVQDEMYNDMILNLKTGEVVELSAELEGAGFQAVSSKEILFTKYTSQKVLYYLVDSETFECRRLMKSDTYVEIIAMDEVWLYYMQSEENEKGEMACYYQRISLETGENQLLFTQRESEKFGISTPVYNLNLTLHGDYLYYLGTQDYRLYLMRRNVENPAKEEVLGEAVYDSRISEVGTVETYYEKFYSEVRPDEYLAYVDLERLVVDERFPGATEINRQLLEKMNADIADERELTKEVQELADSLDDYSIPKYSTSSSVQEISYMDGRYLSFCQEGYDYWGGAHGMPYWIGYTFDLETGKRLMLSDVIGNSEEELKDIVTEYFAEMINESPESFWSDAIENVREWTSLKDSFYLTEEGMKFYYEPYALACYAAGFQSVVIPYDEFEMKIEVNP